MSKERPNSEIRVDANHIGSIYTAIRVGDERAVPNAFAEQRHNHGLVAGFGAGQRSRTNRAQIRSDFIGQHLLQSESEEVRSASTVRAGDDVPAKPCRTPGPPMATGTAVRQAGTNRRHLRDIANAVLGDGSLAVRAREFALEQLATAADGSERISIDDKGTGVWGHGIAATGPDFVRERLGNAFL